MVVDERMQDEPPTPPSEDGKLKRKIRSSIEDDQGAWHSSADLAARLAGNSAALRNLLGQMGLANEFTPLADALAGLVSEVTLLESSLVQRYLAGTASFEHLVTALLGTLANRGVSLSPELLYAFFARQDAEADEWLRARIARLGPRETLSILGYGLGDGSFERALASWLVAGGHCRTVELFGFDPHQVAGAPVVMVEGHQLAERRFDVIIARYVLHHVRPEARWPDLAACVRACRPNGELLIAEQGYPAPGAAAAPGARLEHLLLAALDLVVNAVLYPGWCDPREMEASGFYLSFLSEEDLTGLRQSLPRVVEREIAQVGTYFPSNTMIRYRIG
jgi:SAM-dependent methyltransferase